MDQTKKCENCDKAHDGKYGSGRFCSQSCIKSFATKSIKFKQLKKYNCVDCGCELTLDKRTSPQWARCPTCKKEFKNRKKLCKVCGQKKCNRKDICKRVQLIPGLIKYFGFDESKVGTYGVYEEFERIQNLLREDYWDLELSIPKMMEKYKYTSLNPRNFMKILNSLDIQRRTLSESQTLVMLDKEYQTPYNYKYKHGWHTTWNDKKVFYRSSYELDYMEELDENKIEYEVEKLRILYWDSQQQRQRVAIPDFFLIKDNLIVEVKSNYTYDKQNMMDKMKTYKEHGYKFKLLLDHKFIEI